MIRLLFRAVRVSLGLLLVLAPAAALAQDGKIVLLPFEASQPDSSMSWLASAVPQHMRNLLVRSGFTVEVVQAEAMPDLGAEDWMSSRGASLAILGEVQESTGTLRLDGAILTADGASHPFLLSRKLQELPWLVNEPAFLAVEVLRQSPPRRYRPMVVSPPMPLLNDRELGFGAIPTAEEFAQSETLYETAVRVDPNNADAYYQLGLLYGQARQWLKSIKNLEEAVRKSPKHTKYHSALGLAYFLSGRNDEALGEFLQTALLDDRYVEGFYAQSTIHRQMGDLAQAQVALDRAASIDPGYPLLPLGRAMLLYHGGRRQEAAQELEKLLRDNPRLAMAHNNLGVILLQDGDTAGAAKSFQKALAADPANAQSVGNLALIAYREGKFQDAAAGFTKALAIDPYLRLLSFDLGCAYQMTGNFEQACRHYRDSLAAGSRIAEAMINLGMVEFLRGKYASALENFNIAIDWDTSGVLALYNRAVLNHSFGRQKEALTDYLLANKRAHRLPDAHINLGLIYEEMGLDSKALTEYLKALSMSMEIPEVYLYLGMVYSKLGYHELAVETVTKATLVSFNDPAPYYFLGQLLETTDQVRSADNYARFLEYISQDRNRGPFWRPLVEQKLRSLGR